MHRGPSIAFATATCLSLAAAQARTLHVAPGGEDGGLGTAESPLRTIQRAAEVARAAPIHYQEPFRRDYLDHRGYWQPDVETFCTDLRNARAAGAAGWCFHNGSPSPPDRFPAGRRRSFDLRPSQGRLMDQLDAVEREFVKRAAGCVR